MQKLHSRSSQRARGSRAKCVFRACLLLVLCIWVLYQVKQTYGRTKEHVKNNEMSSEETMVRGKNVVKLGRKDLDPQENPRLEGREIGLTKQGLKEEERVDEDEAQERPEDEEAEQIAEDAIDEDDRERDENEAEDSGNVVLDDLFGDAGDKNIADSREENYKKVEASGSVED